MLVRIFFHLTALNLASFNDFIFFLQLRKIYNQKSFIFNLNKGKQIYDQIIIDGRNKIFILNSWPFV